MYSGSSTPSFCKAEVRKRIKRKPTAATMNCVANPAERKAVDAACKPIE